MPQLSADASRYRYEPDSVAPPGETLAEVLEDRNMSQVDLANRTGLSTKHVNQIISGGAPITSETALLLEKVTRVPARLWNGLESNYRDHLSRLKEETELLADEDWLTELPIKQLIKRGYLVSTSSIPQLVRQVCEFFGVANRATWEALWHKPTLYRKSRVFSSDSGAVASWLRIGELRAADIQCAPYDREQLQEALEEARALTTIPDPGHWWPELVEICAAAGVVIVTEPELIGCRINGAARWLTPHKALIQLSLRGKWRDIFWFTFFHEAGHLLLHAKKETFINQDGAHDLVEDEADRFASRFLIPRRHDRELSELRTVEQVELFAAEIGVGSDIVLGRLQHDGLLSYRFGYPLKQRLAIAEGSVVPA
jgi:HTH-type transcriptional regulator/antitoxin HigA